MVCCQSFQPWKYVKNWLLFLRVKKSRLTFQTKSLNLQQESFHFDIDHEWKRKLVERLDDIGITLPIEDLIAAYENNAHHNGNKGLSCFSKL